MAGVGAFAAGAAVLAICGLIAPRDGRGLVSEEPRRDPPWSRLGFNWLQRRDTRRVEADVAELMEGAARGVRAGLALPAALSEAAARLGGPIAADLHDVDHGLARGLPFADALQRWRRGRSGSSTVELAVDVLLIAGSAGGRASLALEGVAATMRERTELAGDVRAHAAQARASAGVMVLLPPAFLAVSAAVDPRAVEALVTSGPGLLCLISGVSLELIAGLWMRRIVASVTP